MNAVKAPSTQRSPETSTSLTESWNVVDAQEVHSGSEGSDGESIEVIDEEAHNVETILAKEPDDQPVTPVGSPKKVTNTKVASHSTSSEDRSLEPSGNEGIEVISSTSEAAGINIYLVFAFIALFFSLIIGGSVFSMLLRFEEFAFGHLKQYLSPTYSDHSATEYQELLDQIKTYKEQSQDLKGIVADLNAAVLNLKNELATKTAGARYDKKHSLNIDDLLFEQLLNIHSGNHQINNDPDHVPENYENSFKIIQETLKRMVTDKATEETLDTIKLFYLIPKQLSVLGVYYSTDENIKEFIDFWKEKFSLLNDKLMEDIKEMQLKIIRHTLKHLKNSEKSFFKKLCDLKNFKKSECYDNFIKPYGNPEHSLDHKEDYSLGQDKDNENWIDSNFNADTNCIHKINQNNDKNGSGIKQKNEKNDQLTNDVERKSESLPNVDLLAENPNNANNEIEKLSDYKQPVKLRPQPSPPKKIRKQKVLSKAARVVEPAPRKAGVGGRGGKAGGPQKAGGS